MPGMVGPRMPRFVHGTELATDWPFWQLVDFLEDRGWGLDHRMIGSRRIFLRGGKPPIIVHVSDGMVGARYVEEALSIVAAWSEEE